MPSSIGVALIGAGNIAQSIHLPMLKKMPDVRLEAIVDKQIAKARIVAEKHKVPIATRSLDEVLKMPNVDAVIVATSTDAHASIAMEAIAAGKQQGDGSQQDQAHGLEHPAACLRGKGAITAGRCGACAALMPEGARHGLESNRHCRQRGHPGRLPGGL